MREHKFRAWDEDDKEWIDELLFNIDGYGIIHSNKPSHHEIKIVQFTGFKDKNRKEIYEGDIVRFTLYDGEEGVIKEVKLNRHMEYGFSLYMLECEVIGNIYQNPELLKEVKNV